MINKKIKQWLIEQITGDINTRICSKCKKELVEGAFHKQTRICKNCRAAEYREKNDG